MNKILYFLFIGLFGLFYQLKGQDIRDKEYVTSDQYLDSLRNEFNKYQKYSVLRKTISDNWLKIVVGFSDHCDTIFFQGNCYNLQKNRYCYRNVFKKQKSK